MYAFADAHILDPLLLLKCGSIIAYTYLLIWSIIKVWYQLRMVQLIDHLLVHVLWSLC
jgi:hypothetical protein